MALRRVKATFDYLATEPGELSIKKGDIIVVLEEDSTGWWKGDLKGLVGFFPSNFSEPYEEQPTDAGWAQRRMSMAPKPVKDNANTHAAGDEFVRAKHNYKGSVVDGELSFAKGDIIKVINKDESGWWKGELNGKVGFLPHNFVTAVDSATVAARSGATVAAAAAAAPAAKQPSAQPAVAAAAGPAAGGALGGGGGLSAAAKAKALKGKTVGPSNGGTPPPPSAASAVVAPATAAPANAASSAAMVASSARIAELEALVKAAEADALASQARSADLARRADQAERKVEDLERKVEELGQRADEADLRYDKAAEEKTAAEVELRRWGAENCVEWNLNELRDHKHRLKAALERVQVAMNNAKACPACEAAVKDCILVPCLHAFCHKCGEKNKKQVKCSVCGLAPERIYMLSGKK